MASNDFIIRIVLDAQSKIAPVMAAASAEAKKLENQFNGVDRAAASLDKRLVQLDGHVTRTRDTFRSVNPTLESFDRKLKGISVTSTLVGRNLGVLERGAAKAGGALSGLGMIVESLDRKLKDLDRKMTEMGARTYSPKVELEGDEDVKVKLDALTLKLIALERKRRTVRIGIEQEILDREIAQVEAKLKALGDGGEGLTRYLHVRASVDDESFRLADDKARTQTAAFEAANAKRERDQERSFQRLEAEVKASADRRAVVERAARDRNEREERSYNDRRRRQVAAQGDRALTAASNLDDDSRSLKKVRVDQASLAVAREQIASLTGVDLKIGVKLSTIDRAILEAQLAKLGLKREHIKVVLDYNRGEAAIAGSRLGQLFQSSFNRAANGGGGIGANFLSAGGLRTAAIKTAFLFAEPLLSAITAVGGALIAVGAAAGEAAAGLAGMATAAAAQAIPVFGLLALAGTRVAAVIKASSLAQAERDKGAQQSVSVDKARRGAQEALRNAHQGVKDSLDALANAERGVADAQLNVISAQDALNEARREGVRTLEDLLMAERRASLSADESELALSMRQAAGGGGLVQSAQLQAEGDRTDANRASVGAKKAVAGGVNGLPAVVSAQKGVDQAERSLANAQRAVAKAADGVARARRQVDQAAQGVDDAGKKIGAAASAYDIALRKLSSGERTLLRSIEAFKELFAKGSAMREVSDIIVLSFARSLDKVSALFRDSAVLTSFRGLAAGIAKSIDSLATFLTTGPMRTALIFFSDQASKNIGTVGKIFQNLITIFANVAMAASGALSTGLKDVNGWLGHIADKTSPAKAGNLRKFFVDALDPIKAFLGLGGAVVRLFFALGGAGGAADEGTAGIRRLTSTINGATKYVQANGAEVRKFFRESINATSDVLRVVVGLGRALVETFDPRAVSGFSEFITRTVIPVLIGFVKVMGAIDRVIFAVFNNSVVSAIVKFAAPFLLAAFAITKVEMALGRLIVWFSRGRIAAMLYGGVMTVVSAGMAAFAATGSVLAGVMAALNAVNPFVWAAIAAIALYELYKHVGWFHKAVDGVFQFIKKHWKGILILFTGPFAAVIFALSQFGPKLLHGISGAFNAVKSWLSGAAGKLFDPLKAPFDKLKRWADDAFGYVSKKVSGILGSLGIVDSEADKRRKKLEADRKLAAKLAPLDRLPANYRINSDGIQRAGGQSSPTPENAKKNAAVAKINREIDYFATADAKVSPEEAKQIKKLWQDIVRSTDASTKLIATSVRTMRVGIETTVDRLARIISKNFDDINHDARVAWHDFNDSASKNLKTFTDNFRDAMHDASKTAFDGFTYIADAANKALKAYDAKPVSISLSAPRDSGERKADGGWIGQMGERGKDAIHTVLGRGEAVLNATQQKVVEPALNAMYGFGLGDMFKRTRGFHAGGSEQPGFASGGPFGSAPAFVPIANFAKSRFGLTMTAGRTNHNRMSASGNISDHSTGGAGDFSNGVLTPQEDAFNAFIKRRMPETVKQLIWRNVDQFRGYPIGGHEDHVHYAIKPALMASAARMAKIISRASKGLSIESLMAGVGGDGAAEVDHVQTPGVKGEPKNGTMRRLTESVLARVVKATNAKIDEEAGTDRGNISGPGGNDFAGSGFKGPWVERMSQIAEAKNWSLKDWKSLVQGESGGDPTARNKTSGAFGIGQFLGSTLRAYAKFGATSTNPVKQIEAMAQYISDRYKNPTNAFSQWSARSPHWYAKGGIAGMAKSMGLHWGGEQATGGDYIVNKPTMFVAGEKGTERATFQPMAQGRYAGGKAPAPLEVLKKGLENFSGVANVRGIDKVVDSVTDAIDTINATVIKLAGSKKNSKQLNSSLLKMGKALDFLSGDSGPLALFEQQIASAVARATRLLTQRQFRSRSKTDRTLIRSNLSDEAIANQEISNLQTQRTGITQERNDVNTMLRAARSGLKNARTDEQRQLFRGTISTLSNKRASIADSLAANAQSIVERREAAQQTGLDNANSGFDRQRTRLDLARRVNSATGRGGANTDLFVTQAWIAGSQIADLTKRMQAAKSSGNSKMVTAIQAQIDDLNTSIVELGQQRLAALVEKVNSDADKSMGWLDRTSRAGEILGTNNPAGKNSAAIGIFNDQISKLRSINTSSNPELAESVNAKIADLMNSVVELTANSLQAGIDSVNKAADRRDAGIALRGRMADIQTRVGDALGGLRSRGSVLEESLASSTARRDGLMGQLSTARAQGNAGIANDLEDKIAELNTTIAENAQAVKENTFQVRTLSVGIITQASSRTTGLLGSVQTIQGSIAAAAGVSNADQVLSVLSSISTALTKAAAGISGQAGQAIGGNEFGPQGTGILSQLAAAFSSGPAQFADALQSLAPTIAAFESTLGPDALAAFNSLVDGMVGNTTAVVENTAAITGLNGAVTQTFSTTAWTQLRQAIFDGNGGLLPQYDTSQMLSSSASSTTGFQAASGGSNVYNNSTPVASSRSVDSSIGEVNVNVTNPTETADPSYIGKRVAWEIAGSGRM